MKGDLAKMFHSLVIVGNIGKVPEMRFTPKGTAVTSFSVAVNEGYGDKTETLWFNVSVWGNSAEACNEHLQAGQQVTILGKLKPDKDSGNPRTYQRKDGSCGASFDVWANDVRFGKREEKENIPF
jgi:single-strand DNA-binding protein